MFFEVRVSTNCLNPLVKQVSENIFKVRVRAKPVDGKANLEVIKLLAMHFGVKESAVKIIRGASSNRKIVEIAGSQ